MIFDPNCFANHMGAYAIYPEWMRGAVAAVRAGTTALAGPMALANQSRSSLTAGAGRADDDPADGSVGVYGLTRGGVAVISMNGPMTKGVSKFPHANTLAVRRAVRTAAASGDVSTILLHIDSPGGTIAGTEELANDVAAARALKPVHTHFDDLGGSAAYWVGAQASVLTANATALVGSIGAYAVLYDTSGKAEAEGIQVHVVSSGGMKGVGIAGTPITDEVLAEAQGQIDNFHNLFLLAVKKGRGMGIDAVRKLGDGRVHAAAKAVELGLIDSVGSLDDAVRRTERAGETARREARLRGEQADVAIRLAE